MTKQSNTYEFVNQRLDQAAAMKVMGWVMALNTWGKGADGLWYKHPKGDFICRETAFTPTQSSDLKSVALVQQAIIDRGWCIIAIIKDSGSDVRIACWSKEKALLGEHSAWGETYALALTSAAIAACTEHEETV